MLQRHHHHRLRPEFLQQSPVLCTSPSPVYEAHSSKSVPFKTYIQSPHSSIQNPSVVLHYIRRKSSPLLMVHKALCDLGPATSPVSSAAPFPHSGCTSTLMCFQTERRNIQMDNSQTVYKNRTLTHSLQ